MKPYMMGFKQGEQRIYVNMDQVCHIMTDGATGSMLTFNAVMDNCPAYLCVTEPPDEIIARMQ